MLLKIYTRSTRQTFRSFHLIQTLQSPGGEHAVERLTGVNLGKRKRKVLNNRLARS